MTEFDPFDLSVPRKRVEFVSGWKWFICFFGVVTLLIFLSSLILPRVSPKKEWFDLPIFSVVIGCFGGWYVGRKTSQDLFSSSEVVPTEYRSAFGGLGLQERQMSAFCIQSGFLLFLPKIMGRTLSVPKEFLESVSLDSVRWCLELELRVAKEFEAFAAKLLSSAFVVIVVALILAASGFYRLASCLVGLCVVMVMMMVLLTARGRIEKRLARREDREFAREVLQFALDRAVEVNQAARVGRVDEKAILNRAKAYHLELRYQGGEV